MGTSVYLKIMEYMIKQYKNTEKQGKANHQDFHTFGLYWQQKVSAL